MTASTGNLSALPPMSDVAAALREGEALDMIAMTFGVTPRQLRYRLNEAGWGMGGDPFTETTREPKPTFVRGDLSWQDRAVCSSTDPEAFFPEKGRSSKSAVAVCNNGCPVREQCLQWALANDFDEGVFGGKTRMERRAMKRKAAKQDTAA